MKNIYDYLMKHSVPAVFTVLTGITLVTSAAGVVKVAGNVNSFKPKVPEIKTVEAALKEDSDLLKVSPPPLPKVTKAISPTAVPIITVNGGVKPSVSVQGDEEDDNKEVKEVKDKKDDSNHAKLELDNDFDLNAGVEIKGATDSNN